MPFPPATTVASALRAAGASGEIRELDRPVPTAAAAAEALGCEVGAIANSLVFAVGDAPLLVIAGGAHRVDTRGLARRLGTAKIRRASREFVLAHTGQQVGGVAPVGHPGPVRTVLDADLAGYPVVWAGGGDEYTMFQTSFEELLSLTGGASVEVV
jgi:prolyl-tRNA editing enzyme YbaK/EbsC (Cys-tRNA(Pro) deacylase)